MIRITNKSNSALIEMHGEIGGGFFDEGWTLEKFNGKLEGLDVSNLTIELKSGGGDLLEAFAIYDSIKNMPTRVTVDIVGTSASAATVIASAADRIRISENSRYLVHNAQTFVQGNKEDIGDAYDTLKSLDNQILNIYVKRTGKSKNDLAELMKEEKLMTATDALAWGFVDEIIKNKIENNLIKNVMNEEEVAALQAENEALKAQVVELQEKLDEIEVSDAVALEEELEEEVTAAIEAGKIQAEQKDAWKNFGTMDKIAMRNAIGAINISEKSLKDVPEKGSVQEYKNKQEVWAAFKEKKIDMNQAGEAIKKLS